MLYRFEDCVLDTARRELRRSGLLCPLEPQVFDLLYFLIANRERVVSRDEIFKIVWRGRIVSDSVLGNRINAARKAIGDDGTQQRLIRTLRRNGFRFVGSVREETESTSPPALFRDITALYPLTCSLSGAPIVTVRPVLNQTGDFCWQHATNGLTQELTAALSKFNWIAVRTEDDSLTARGAGPPATFLGMKYVLLCRLRQSGDRLRVNVNLNEQPLGCVVWSGCYELESPNLFAVQDEIAKGVATGVANQLYATERIRTALKTPENLTLWERIVRVLMLISTRNKPSVNMAEKLLTQAISADPNSSVAHSLYSFVCSLRVHMGWHLRKTRIPAAIESAKKALALNSEEPWAHLALGYALTQIRPDESIASLEHALKLDPNLSIAHYFIAIACSYIGNYEDAFRHADLAESLSQRDLLTRGNIGAHDNVRATTCFVAGKYHDGIAFARSVIMQNPRQTPALRQIIVNGAMAGEFEQAKSALKLVQRITPDIEGWLHEYASVWGRGEDYQKYVEGFRIAGFKS